MLRSDRIVAFIERLRVPSGKLAGKRIKLAEWEKRLIRDAYDPVDSNHRRLVRRVLWTMAKKNGKTTLIAALVLVHLVGPEAGPGQEIYSAANSREQASLVYRAAETMVEMSPELKLLVQTVPSRKRLVCRMYASFYQALSADAKLGEGISPTVWIYDELGKTTRTALYESLANAQGAWEEPLGIVISVQARDPHSIMSELVAYGRKILSGEIVDPSWAVAIFEVPPDADPFDESVWHLANPALGEFNSLEDLRQAAAEAKRMPSRLNGFRNLRLNQQVDDLVSHIHLREDWEACNGGFDLESLRGQRCFGGLDLSRRIDLSALVLVFPDIHPKPVLCRIWTPEHRLEDRAVKDNAPYKRWVDEGHLIAVPGKVIDYAWVAKEIATLAAWFRIESIAFDRYGIAVLRDAMNAEGVPFYVLEEDEPEEGVLCFQPFGQGFKDMSPAIEQMEVDVMEHNFAHGGHPVLTWAASNAVTMGDPAGNRKLAKHRARNRIDPYVALTMANAVATRPAAPVEDMSSIYDDPAKLLETMREAMR